MSTFPAQMKPRDEFIDLVRGLSALFVLVSHVRGMILCDFVELTSTNIPLKLFYAVTGVSHQAVMVFFVLSGYFVGGSVLDAVWKNRFSWNHYAIARLVRLWMVLLPALLLTGVLDHCGQFLDPDAYAGIFYGKYRSGPSAANPLSLSVVTFLGNLAFLQTVACPTYGTNGPLWSLANEFWYYVLFPLGVTCLYSWRTRPKRWAYGIANGGLAAILIWNLPPPIVNAGVVWLFGVAVWIVSQERRWMWLIRNWRWRLGFGLAFLGALVASKTSSIFGTDNVVGAAFALWMPSLLGPWSKIGWWSRLSVGLSEVSYTLYVVHFPLLFFVSGVLLHGRQYEPGLAGFGYFAAMTCAALLLSFVMWWTFESNTAKVRRLIELR